MVEVSGEFLVALVTVSAVLLGIGVLVWTGSSTYVLTVQALPLAVYVPLLVRAHNQHLAMNEAAPPLLVVAPLVALLSLNVCADWWFGDLSALKRGGWVPLLMSYAVPLVTLVLATVLLASVNSLLYLWSAIALVSLVPLTIYWLYLQSQRKGLA